MAEQTKKIIFEAQDNGVASTQDRLRAGAEQLARSFIRSAREYSTSGKEVINYLEEEIRLLEKRDRLASRVAQGQLDTSYRRQMEKAPAWRQPAITEEYRSQSAQISEDAKINALQVELLRELIDTIKHTSKEEIREDRKVVEEKLTKDRSVGRLGLAESADEIDELKKTLQYEAVGSVKESEQEERNRFKFGTAAGRGFNSAAGVAVQPNEFFMAAAVLAMIPIIGQGLSAIGGKMFSSAQEYEGALGKYTALTGTPIGGAVGIGPSFSQYGMTRSQSMDMAINLARARGERGEGNIFWTGAQMQAQYMRGLGLSESDLLQTERLSRGGRFLGGAVPWNLVQSLGSRGVMSTSDTSLLPEYLQLFNQLSQQQLEVLGSIDQGINTNLISAVASMGGIFSNPDNLKRIMPSFQSGLSRPVNAGVRALQLYTLQRANPNMSLLELEMEQEKGLAGMDGTYLTEYLKTLKGRSGNQDMFIRNIAGSFGLSLNLSSQIAEGFTSGKLSTEQLLGLAKGENVSGNVSTSLDLRERAQAGTGELAKSTARISDFFAVRGEQMVQALVGIESKLGTWLDRINGELGDTGGGFKAYNEEWKQMTPAERVATTRVMQSTSVGLPGTAGLGLATALQIKLWLTKNKVYSDTP